MNQLSQRLLRCLRQRLSEVVQLALGHIVKPRLDEQKQPALQPRVQPKASEVFEKLVALEMRKGRSRKDAEQLVQSFA